MFELSDALAYVAIENSEEITLIQTIIGPVWGKSAPPHVANSPKQGKSCEFRLVKMAGANLRIPRGISSRINQKYRPSHRCGGAIGDIYKFDIIADGPELPEV